MPLKNVYATGTSTLRDAWGNPKTILAVQSGYETHHVDAHRHRDQNSFILVHRNERFFADPGHCCYRLETWKQSCTSEHHNTWDFIAEDGTVFTQLPIKAGKDPINRNVSYESDIPGVEILAADCAKAYGEHFERCERVFVCKMPHVIFIIDRIKADLPVKVCSHFVLNNRDNGLKVHKADDFRLVLRRGDAGIKFFSFGQESLSQRWGFIHDFYHPLPNQVGQGKEGSSYIYDYTTSEFAKEHILLRALALDGTETVKGWHIKKTDGGITVFAPGDLEKLTLKTDADAEKWFSVEW